ncbi:hypothetical protein LIER_00735 [Lithospermum erythrorhizon]|uniref:DUF4283 domain-containing protein n=1 Tax=Lithospermum erythrorhizon TaxID=34254 RepID=A0AAV3NJ72_LITER
MKHLSGALEEVNRQQPIPTYVETVGTMKPSRMKLTFILPKEVNGKQVVKYQLNDVIPGSNRWRSAAYGYVIGLNPNLTVVERFAKSRWGEFGFEKLYKLSSGLFLFEFSTDEESDRMLAEDPWIFAQYPMILNFWSPEAILDKKGVERIPLLPVPIAHEVEKEVEPSPVEHDSIVNSIDLQITPLPAAVVPIANPFTVLDCVEKKGRMILSVVCLRRRWKARPMNNKAWIVGGDFNIVKAFSESVGGAILIWEL